MIKLFVKKKILGLSRILKNALSFFLKRWLTEPDFIIIGVQKAGTSSLYQYLTQHPLIKPAAIKEVHYFDLNFSKNDDWYKSHFPLRIRKTKEFITGEASPYYIYHPHSLKRISSFKPDIKIIIILRDPVDRAVSHYHHENRKGREPLELMEAFKSERERIKPELEKMHKNPLFNSTVHQRYSYKDRGKYVYQLKKVFNLFPKENILLLDSEEFFSSPNVTLNRVFRFLEVSNEIRIKKRRKFNVGNYSRNKIPKEVISYLRKYFQPYNNELQEYTEIEFSWLKDATN